MSKQEEEEALFDIYFHTNTNDQYYIITLINR
jgi:hypothetical protein